MGTGVTAQLAASLAALDPDDLSAEVVAKARECLLDSLGCMLGGTRVAEVRRTVDLVLEWGQKPEAAVPGLAGRYPAPLAAYAAAQLGNALDYDDTVTGLGHPGAAIVATALALGQARGADGKELLRAIVVGYEAAIRIGRATEPTRARATQVRGHSWAVFGAAAAAAVLLDLDAEQLAEAFGLAAQHAMVPFVGKWYERPIATVKNNYGWAAAGGILAAGLVTRGARSNREVLDGQTGFWAMASSDRWDPEVVLAGLGTGSAILAVEFKPFAACRYMHPALDALGELVRQHAPDPASIRAVVVRAAERARVFADHRPERLLAAQYSLPHAIASVLLGRPLTSFDADDRAVGELARRVRIETDPEAERRMSFDGLPASVEVELADGRRLRARSDVPPGDPARPLSGHHLRTKFLELAVPILGADAAERLGRLVRDRPGLPSAAELADTFAARTGAAVSGVT